MDRGAWQAIQSIGSPKVRHDGSDLACMGAYIYIYSAPHPTPHLGQASGMWVLDQGSNPSPLHCKRGVLTTGLPEKSL